jgi:hypothetical protein
MNFLRRAISIFSIAILLVIIVYGLFWLKTRSSYNQDPEMIIPADFSLYLRINDFQEFQRKVVEENPVYRELLNSGIFELGQEFDSKIAELDSLRKNNSGLNDIFSGRILISLHEVENNYHLLFTRKKEDQNFTEEWLKLLGNDHEITKSKFENQAYYYIQFQDSSLFKTLSFFEDKGILAVSTSEDLLKNAIRTMNSEEHVLQSPVFQRLYSTAGSDVIANLFLNYKEFNPFVRSFFKEEGIKDLSEQFTSSVLDIELHTENIVINGFTGFYGIQSPEYLEYKEAEKGFSLLQNLPFDPAFFEFQKGADIFDFSEDKEIITKDDFRNNLASQLKEEACFYIKKVGNKFSRGILIDLQSGFTTEEFLKENLSMFSKSGNSPETNNFSIDNNQFTLYKTSDNFFTKYVKANKDKDRNFPYFAVYNNVLIFSDSQELIRDFIYSNMLGTTLNNSNEFKALSGNVSSSSNVFSYINTPVYFDILLEKLRPELAVKLKQSKSQLKKFDALSFQSTRSDDLHYFRIFVNYSGKQREGAETVWKRKLDTLSDFKPTIVLNHNNGAKEIMLQDSDQNLYLISNTGNILWKQKLEGSILGEIFQVDYYNNGKLQYFFNTEEKLYLLDRNGNPVEKFPVALREKASAGLSILDYDDNRDWRIPVPSTDRKIYMYDKEGKLVSGWKFKTDDYPVYNPVQHLKLGNKDYLIAKEEFQIYFLDRRGRKRIKPDQQIQFSNNPVFYDRGEGNPYIIATDKKGSIYKFYFNEKVELFMENDFSSDHHFMAVDISGDRKKEFIFIDKQTVLVFDDKKNIVFKGDLPENIKLPPVIYEFSANDKKIGIVATKSGEIYLYNKDGSQYDGFPLKGSSLFSISSFPGLKDRFNLIVSNKDNFLYNYSVQ